MIIVVRLLKPIALVVGVSLVLFSYVGAGRFGLPEVVRSSLGFFVASASSSPDALMTPAGTQMRQNEPSCGGAWRQVSRGGGGVPPSDCRRFGRTVSVPPAGDKN